MQQLSTPTRPIEPNFRQFELNLPGNSRAVESIRIEPIGAMLVNPGDTSPCKQPEHFADPGIGGLVATLHDLSHPIEVARRIAAQVGSQDQVGSFSAFLHPLFDVDPNRLIEDIEQRSNSGLAIS